MPGTFMPPNGFAGFAQQTPAVQSLYSRKSGGGGGGTRRRKKSAAGAVAKVRRAKRRVSKAGGRMKAGSAAAKAWGKKMKRLRNRRG